MSDPVGARPSSTTELVPVADRLSVLQVARTAMGIMVLVFVAALPGSVDHELELVVLTGAYLGITAGVEVARRTWVGRGQAVVSTMLLVDGAWVAFALLRTGGPEGPLGVLVCVHIVAVVLLCSHRSGLKVALWHAVLLVVTAPGPYGRGGEVELSSSSQRLVAYHAMAYLLVAAGASWFSSLNERALRRGKGELASLVALSSDLERAHGVDDVHVALARHITDRLGFARVAVVTSDDGRCSGVVRQDGHDVLVGGSSLELEPSLDDLAGPGRSAELLRVLDPGQTPVFDYLLPWASNVVVVRLVTENRLRSVLVAEWGARRGGGVPRQTYETLDQSAAHAALALRNNALLAEVELLATRDPLTGLVNRRVFDDALERAVAAAERGVAPLSLVVVDLDHFKDVNDTYGHPVGDRVLRDLGRILAANSRSADVAARVGGEEFAVLLPSCSGAEAFVIAERVRAAMSGGGSEIPVTLSAGVATLPDNATTADGLVGAADAAMYTSKRAGRDRSTRSRAEVVRRPESVPAR